MARKSINKSIRLSEEVYGYINNYRGEGFNEKFENIILDYQKAEKDIQERIKAKKKELELWENQVYSAAQKVRKLDSLKYRIDNCMDYVKSIEGELKGLASVSQK